MNAKLAKRMRRAAEKETVGMPATQLMQTKDGVVYNHPKTTRGAVRFLKRTFRKAPHK
jgi:hypothetical protein